jgi:hypothetical protein
MQMEISTVEAPSPNQPPLSAVACCCPDPIFIIGAPRSGTTALAKALGQHSQLWAFDETQIFWDLFGSQQAHKNYCRRADDSWLRREGVEEERFLFFLGLGLNALLTTLSHGKRWIDQTPVYTLMVGDLAAMFPGARFLHIMRDGRRAVHSMINYPYKQAPWARSFREAAKTWHSYTNAALNFCQSHPERSRTVINERLVVDSEGGFEEILEFLKAPYENAPGNYFRTNRVNSSFARANSRPSELLGQPWKHWTEEQSSTFHAEAGETLQRYESGQAAVQRTIAPDQFAHKTVDALVPMEAVIMVVSKGDSTFLRMEKRVCWHFPSTSDGEYAGYHPADSQEAIGHLEELRTRGGEYLLFPESAFWWFEFYGPFRQHLDERYPKLWCDQNLVLYHLSGASQPRESSRVEKTEGILADNGA